MTLQQAVSVLKEWNILSCHEVDRELRVAVAMSIAVMTRVAVYFPQEKS